MQLHSTTSSAYAQRLWRIDRSAWRRILNVQAPYRWNLERLRMGRTLEVGCGTGRNLVHLDAVGVDHNSNAIELARSRGCVAYSTWEFAAAPEAVVAGFDSLLFAHVFEHMQPGQATELVASYLRYLRPQGQVISICPQEAGFRSDPTHVAFVDHQRMSEILEPLGLTLTRRFSFPFPRPVGRRFPYNEFVAVATTGAPSRK